jgi:ribosomal protein S21
MLKIKVHNKNIDQALKIYKNKVYKTKLLLNLSQNKTYKKPSEIGREDRKKAVYKNNKNLDKD